ncbi:TMEM175 family protein [Lactococcus termiticola]|uniref:Putative integral membrane protein n=1 Tax=Lactococcus termiticola TaxID=2169526 RepID=A0A2R5HJS5_9LACT|nr:TMEM175 family protein [Lactococcus termiticola]GBG96918.1 putative integral membrane protein [Lactococcus termiticola]
MEEDQSKEIKNEPSEEAITEGLGRMIGQSFGMPTKSEEQRQREAKKSRMSPRQQRKYEELKRNPEMIQARKELQEEFLAAHPHYAEMSDAELMREMKLHAEEDDRTRKRKLRDHIETFSDGMIAIIITIMLLEIPVPSEHVGYLEFIESVGVFLVSFVVIANFWFNRHKIFALTEEITESIIVQDFIFTGLLSLIPILTKWIMVNPSPFSALNFGGVLILILIFQEGLSYSITKSHFKDMPKSFMFWRRIWAGRVFMTLLLNLVITGIAIASPFYGHWLFVIVPIFYFIVRFFNDRNNKRTFDEQLENGERAIGVPYMKE